MNPGPDNDDDPESVGPFTPDEGMRAPDSSWLRQYEGLGLDEAKARADREGRRYRVIGPDSVVTADFNVSRLNLIVDADGNLTEMRAG